VRHDAVTWLDFRADDLARARDFIRSLQEEAVLDELGFLALLGRFSDLLHPATTTLMRSARYLYFIAGIYRSLEREGVRASQVPHLSRQRQDELRDALSATETVGVIARDAGINLRQFPSAICWSGLKKLGMFTPNLSESAYQEQFDDIRRSRRGYQDDDKTPQGPEGQLLGQCRSRVLLRHAEERRGHGCVSHQSRRAHRDRQLYPRLLQSDPATLGARQLVAGQLCKDDGRVTNQPASWRPSGRGRFTLYLALHGVAANWKRPIQNWKQALNQFSIRFGDRIPA